MKHSMRLSNFFPLVFLASCVILASAVVEKRGIEYRRHRKRNLDRDPVAVTATTVSNKDGQRQAAKIRSATTANRDSKNEAKKLDRDKRRTRGQHHSSNRKQSRRELGKSSGGKSSGKSGSSGGSGGSSGGSSGSGSGHSGAGWNSSDGSYCGCLCMSQNDVYSVNNHGIDCDFTVVQNSYGYLQSSSNIEYDNSGSYTTSYFQFNKFTNWEVVDEGDDGYFKAYYNNQNSQQENYEGRNGADDAYEGDDQANANDDGAQQEQENQDEVVVVNQMDSGYDPYMAFDIASCDTYAHLWTYDLLVSCADGDQNCECTFAEELMFKGLLSCSDIEFCPDECGVCSNCIRSVCDKYIPSKLIAGGIQNNAGIATAAIFSTVLLAVCVAVRNKRNKAKHGKLNESLMEDGDDTCYTAKNWEVPVNEATGLPEETGQKSKTKPVWLAPDVSTIPTKPLFPDLLKGKIGEKGKQKTGGVANALDEGSEKSTTSSNNGSSLVEKEGVKLSPVAKRDYPGPWLVPTSDQSVPSSMSNSSQSGDDSCGFSRHDTRSDGRSIGTMEGEI